LKNRGKSRRTKKLTGKRKPVKIKLLIDESGLGIPLSGDAAIAAEIQIGWTSIVLNPSFVDV